MNRVLKRVHLLLDFFVQKPMRCLTLIFALQMAGWGVMANFFLPIPHYDILLHSVIGRNWEFGDDYLHPPLVYILAHWFNGGFNGGEGVNAYIHYMAAQLFVIATYGAVYYVGLALFNNKSQALVATLLLVGLRAYQQGTWYGVNHNVIQYPFWALIPLLTLYATRPLTQKAHQHRWWLLLGFVMGVALWTKHSIVLLLATVALWVIVDKEARSHLLTPHPYFAALLCLMIGSGALWLAYDQWRIDYGHMIAGWSHNEYSPLKHMVLATRWIFISALLAGLISWRTQLTYPFHQMERRQTNWILIVTLMPFLPILTIDLLTEISVSLEWLYPMYPLLGILLVAVTRHSWRSYSPHVVLCVAVVLLLKPFYYHPFKKDLYLDWNNHQKIAMAIIEKWNHTTNDAPLRNVFGNIGYLGGLVTLHEGDETHLNYLSHKSQADARLQKEGGLFVFDENDWKKEYFRHVIKRLQLQEKKMKIDQYPHVIYYAILPPAEP